MIISFKDCFKLLGVMICAFCAVLVCSMFINYGIDFKTIESQILPQYVSAYEAISLSGKVTCLVSGGCLGLTAAVMLIFYIKNYVDSHKKELGILKALGYSNLRISAGFAGFGLSVFAGTTAGFAASRLVMPIYYEMQNDKGWFPDIPVRLHPSVFLGLVILPSAVFALLSIAYAAISLRKPALSLLRESVAEKPVKNVRTPQKHPERGFLDELRVVTLSRKKLLTFFVIFAAFCFSSMTQMSFSMKDLASPMIAIFMISIGLLLAVTAFFLSITSVIKGNSKSIAMMTAMGYSEKECRSAVLDGYRPLGYIGFAVGTVYQYLLLRVMVDVVFKDVAEVPVYKFNFPMMFISLAAYIIIYEAAIYGYSRRLKRITVKEIMSE